jgi:hypothetical protein
LKSCIILQFLLFPDFHQKKAVSDELGFKIDNPIGTDFFAFSSEPVVLKFKGAMVGIFGILESSAAYYY